MLVLSKAGILLSQQSLSNLLLCLSMQVIKAFFFTSQALSVMQTVVWWKITLF